MTRRQLCGGQDSGARRISQKSIITQRTGHISLIIYIIISRARIARGVCSARLAISCCYLPLSLSLCLSLFYSVDQSLDSLIEEGGCSTGSSMIMQPEWSDNKPRNTCDLFVLNALGS